MITLEQQQEKLERLLDERVTHYRRGVAKGRLALDVASAKHAECEAIRASFAFLVRHQAWIRAEAQRRRSIAAELAAAERDPAVQAVKATFPDAEVAAVRSLRAPSDPRAPSRPSGAEDHHTQQGAPAP